MGDLVLFLPFLALFGVIIYMQTRQRKKIQAKQTELQAALSVGAPIMLTCGLYGDVAGLDDATVDVEIAPGVVARFARAAVLEVRSAEPAEPAVDEDDLEEVSDETGIDTARTDPSTARPAKPLAHDDPSA